jgi:hypothetical protein
MAGQAALRAGAPGAPRPQLRPGGSRLFSRMPRLLDWRHAGSVGPPDMPGRRRASGLATWPARLEGSRCPLGGRQAQRASHAGRAVCGAHRSAPHAVRGADLRNVKSAQATLPCRAGGGIEDNQQRPAGAGNLALPAAAARARARAGRRAAAAHAHNAPVGVVGVWPLRRRPKGAAA